jgi:hypothetical protein
MKYFMKVGFDRAGLKKKGIMCATASKLVNKHRESPGFEILF